MINLKFVSKVVRNQAILSNINLKIEEGDFVYLTGPSDSGKTTLLKLIYGFFPPSGGQVIVMGRDIAKLSKGNLSEIRKKVGLVMQDFGFLEKKTTEENLHLFLSGLSVRERAVMIDLALHLVELTPKRKLLVSSLSGSERQQLRWARCMALNPKLILADEPLLSLDEKKERLFLKILLDMNEKGTTVIFASSRPEDVLMSTIRKKMVRLSGGRIE
ncbi:ABC transporter ATP-binding protein [bacterium]|nr:ABC transporter ATP-binding protein [bacterium]MBU2462255.1 ABC transporter ATP-binding protein [bacterium]